MIKIENLNVKFDNKTIFDNYNLVLPNNGFILIRGKSGIGKSTLLNILSGGFKANGKILYNDVNIYENDDIFEEYRKNKVSYMNQKHDLFNGLSVFDNLSIASEINGKKFSEDEIVAYLNDFGLNGKINQNVSKLSGGEKRRVSFIRTIIISKEIIIGDEIISQLDRKNQILILEKLKELSKTKLVILASHDNIALEYSDIIVDLNNKTIEEINEIKENNIINIDKENKISFKNRYKLSKELIFKDKKLLFIFFSIYTIILFLVLIVFECLGYDYNEHYKKLLNNNNVLSITLSEKNPISTQHLNDVYNLYIDDGLKVYSENYKYNDFTREAYFIEYNKEIIENCKINIIAGGINNKDEVLISNYVANALNNENNNIIGKKIFILDTYKTISGIYIKNDEYINSDEIGMGIFGYDLDNKLKDDHYKIIVYSKDFDSYCDKLDDFYIGIDYFKEEIKVDDFMFKYKLLGSIFMISFEFILFIFEILYSYLSLSSLKKEISLLLYLGASKKDCKMIFIMNHIYILGIITVLFNILMWPLNYLLNSIIRNKLYLTLINFPFLYNYWNILVSLLMFSITSIILYLSISLFLNRDIVKIDR